MPRSVGLRTMLVCCVALSLAHAGRPSPVVQRRPDARLAAILSRAAAYTTRFKEEFQNVVVEERYTQKVARVQRTLRSDVVLVRPPGNDEWMLFRDVFEVDGKAVRDRDERIRRLFTDAPATAVVAALRIAEESARYSLAPFYRETADPVLPLLFLDERNQPRFEFRFRGNETVEGRQACRIDYTETQVPTMIQYEAFDTPASGSLWVRADDAALIKGTVKALLRKGRAVTRLDVEVVFRPSSAIGLLVPAELRERFQWTTGELVGDATYANLRTFKTDARIVVPR